MASMTLLERLERISLGEHLDLADIVCGDAATEIRNLRQIVGWVETWVSNPAASYSTAALDGLFGLTRDKIAALPKC